MMREAKGLETPNQLQSLSVNVEVDAKKDALECAVERAKVISCHACKGVGKFDGK